MTFNWTDERCAELRERWKTESASQIGKSWGITRNTVIGKMRRLGLSAKDKTEAHPHDTYAPEEIRKKSNPNRPPVQRKPCVRKSKLHIVANGGGGMRITESIASDLPELRCAEVSPTIWIEHDDLKKDHCRWPYGDGPFVFCGHSKFVGSYCWQHYKLAVGNGTPSERAAHKVSRRAA